ncbi:MAG: hypothetical protein M5U34_33255 [Chloroflexi bacterium]|nr:hypothetical protein [Chloroflexota bacterium]
MGRSPLTAVPCASSRPTKKPSSSTWNTMWATSGTSNTNPTRLSSHPMWENIRVSQKRKLPPMSDMVAFVQQQMPPLAGGVEVLYGGVTQHTKAGALYIAERTGIPAASTLFWQPDQPLIRDDDSKRIRYRYGGAEGTNAHLCRLPGTARQKFRPGRLCAFPWRIGGGQKRCQQANCAVMCSFPAGFCPQLPPPLPPLIPGICPTTIPGLRFRRGVAARAGSFCGAPQSPLCHA